MGKLKRRVENLARAHDLSLPLHERIEDASFRRAVDLLDAGDLEGLRIHLSAYQVVVRQRITFEGGNYFCNPALLEFIAENPVRRGKMPANVLQVAKLILDAGAREDRQALNETLALVSSGRVAHECGAQVPLIDLLCSYGADPDYTMPPALPHGEFEAVQALIRNGARIDLPVAAGLGQAQDCERLIPGASPEDRHRALALAAQFGRAAIVRMLLDAGEDPSRNNPVGCHGHSTPLHQAAAGGHLDVVRLLVERGAQPDIKETMWQGTPARWVEHEGKKEVKDFLAAAAESGA